jgi:hypothetical protein
LDGAFAAVAGQLTVAVAGQLEIVAVPTGGCAKTLLESISRKAITQAVYSLCSLSHGPTPLPIVVEESSLAYNYCSVSVPRFTLIFTLVAELLELAAGT